MKLRDLLTLIGLSRRLVPRPCPVCGATDITPLLTRDRYFLPIRVGQCRDCGAVYASRALDEAGAAAYYGRLYPALMASHDPDAFDQQRAAIAALRAERVAAICGAPGRVLEIGCGAGWFLAAIQRAGGVSLTGIEPGPAAAAAARERLGTDARILHAPLEQIDPPVGGAAGGYDLIAAFHVLEHIADPGTALKRCADWLAPDGWLVLEVPDITGDWAVLGLMNFHIGHASYFSPASLTRLLARHGFAVIHHEREGAESVIHPGNLRLFARRGPGAAPMEPPDLAAAIGAKIRRWSWRHGYPRALIRLVRLLLMR